MARPRRKHVTIVKSIILYLILPLLFVVLPLLFSVSHELSATQANFRRGTIPSQLSGDYQGEQKFAPAGWYGKTFDPASKTGSNIYLRADNSRYTDYEFVFYSAMDIRNPKQEVIRLSYQKPFFMKPFTSEIVEYQGKLIGKTYLMLPLQIHLTTGFFTLEATTD